MVTHDYSFVSLFCFIYVKKNFLVHCLVGTELRVPTFNMMVRAFRKGLRALTVPSYLDVSGLEPQSSNRLCHFVPFSHGLAELRLTARGKERSIKGKNNPVTRDDKAFTTLSFLT